MKVLTIGNSFSLCLRSCLPAIAENQGVDLELNVQSTYFGGCEMARHWAYICAEENEPLCRIYEKGGRKLRDLLACTAWDVVTIQQASRQSWDYSKYQPYGHLLKEYVKQYAPKAKIFFQQTWSYRADAPLLTEWGFDEQEMFRRINEASRKFCKEEGLEIIPTGFAVEMARHEQPGGAFVNYDPALLTQLRWPDLPPQSRALAGKCFWMKNAQGELEIGRDTNHLNIRGEYLQAAVWFGFLFKKDPEKITWVPDEIGNADAAFLRSVAKRALKEF